MITDALGLMKELERLIGSYGNLPIAGYEGLDLSPRVGCEVSPVYIVPTETAKRFEKVDNIGKFNVGAVKCLEIRFREPIVLKCQPQLT